MKLIYAISLCFTCTLACQQPPAKPMASVHEKMEYVAQKAEDIGVELKEVHENYIESLVMIHEATKSALHQKGNVVLDSSALNFSCIIDRENDATILSQLVKMHAHFAKLIELETKLEKTEPELTQNPHNVFLLEQENQIDANIALEDRQFFNSLMQLCYQHAIRRHQKAGQIRGQLPKLLNP